jgi:hypothetical protein
LANHRPTPFSATKAPQKPNRPAVEHEYDKVKAENDRVAREVTRYLDRLRGFCGVNPLKDYALTEIARRAQMPSMRHGLKLHFGNSDVMFDDPEHVAKLREVFRAANGAGPGDRRAHAVVGDAAACVRRGAGARLSERRAAVRHRTSPSRSRISPAARHVYIEVSGVAGLGRSRDRDPLGRGADPAGRARAHPLRIRWNRR